VTLPNPDLLDDINGAASAQGDGLPLLLCRRTARNRFGGDRRRHLTDTPTDKKRGVFRPRLLRYWRSSIRNCLLVSPRTSPQQRSLTSMCMGPGRSLHKH